MKNTLIKKPSKMSARTREKVWLTFCTAVCVFMALICLFPLLYVVNVSFYSKAEFIEKSGMTLWLPSSPTLAGYAMIIASIEVIAKAMLVSIGRTVIGTLLSMFITAITAYILTRKDLPGKNAYMGLILFTILFSGGLIPTYLTIDALGLRNTFWVYIIPTLFSGWNVLIFKQFFEGIPKELEEAAEVDGVGMVAMFIKIIVPMSKPVLASIGLFTMVGHWNSWFDVSIYIDAAHNDLYTLQYYTKTVIDSASNLTQNPGALEFFIQNGESVNTISMQMALTVVTFIPMLCVYPFFQKYFTKGVYLGAVKG